jgi:hypothetical protein
MSYKFFKVMRNKETKEIVNELFELESQDDLPGWEKEHLDWHDSKKDLLDSEKDADTFIPKAKEVEKEKTLSLGGGKLELTEDQLKIIVRLLKGEQINTRRGLSLTSFSNVFGVTYNDLPGKKRLRPQYEILLNQLKSKDEIRQVRKSWYYKNAHVRDRKG